MRGRGSWHWRDEGGIGRGKMARKGECTVFAEWPHHRECYEVPGWVWPQCWSGHQRRYDVRHEMLTQRALVCALVCTDSNTKKGVLSQQ